MKTTYFEKAYSFDEANRLKIVNNMGPVSVSQSETDQLIIVANFGVKSDEEEQDFEDYFKLVNKSGDITIDLDELDDSFDRGKMSVLKIEIMIPKLSKLKLEGENYPFSVNGVEADIEMVMENGPAVFSNCTGKMHLESENGPIKIHNLKGDLKVVMENGPLSTDGLSGDSLKIESENGAIKMRSSAFREVEVRNENGVIYYESLPVEDARMNFENENGVISLILPEMWGFEITAESEMGVIKNKLGVPYEKQDDSYILKTGENPAIIKIKTENGVIKLAYDRHLNLDYLRSKLDQLKVALAGAKGLEDREDIRKLVENLITYLNKGLDAIPEEKIKEAIQQAIAKLKELAESPNLADAKEKLSIRVEAIGVDLQNAYQEFSKSFQEKVNAESIKGFKDKIMGSGFAHVVDPELGDKITEKVFKTIRKVAPGVFDLRAAEKENIAEQSRLKILEMLESGKITAEDAERLLKAIGKE
ncbi:MAG: hypothetical protein CVU49_09170 [Candidatus Cloacimonetes bacterium HGW-Cloacimonetes-2]|jgi:DUF4097 and DUF4098 domain-containing protein YvlB|nr:MAG: hypothetical protein CVU49_09170 [Candidatus Cloacimonetes bacterium HGW-Cloacimonetes-2]